MIIWIIIVLLLILLGYQIYYQIEPLESMDEISNTNTSENNSSIPVPSTVSTTIETNMLSLNTQLNDLRAKYEDLSKKVNTIQKDAKELSSSTTAAEELVGSTPIKIDMSK